MTMMTVMLVLMVLVNCALVAAFPGVVVFLKEALCLLAYADTKADDCNL